MEELETEMKVKFEVEVEEQMELEEQVEVVGAGTHRDGGDPRASATLWPPMPLPAGGEKRLLEKMYSEKCPEKLDLVNFGKT